LLISSAVAAVFVAWGGFERVVAVLAFFFVANYTLSFTSLFVLRKRNVERPFRAIGHPFTTGLALLASIAFLAGAIRSDLMTSLWALGVLAASVPVYLLVRKLR
jgi:APA family basic amino acid/polyamine antiporter